MGKMADFDGPFWERHLGHMEETIVYGITTIAYFVAVMFGFGELENNNQIDHWRFQLTDGSSSNPIPIREWPE